MSGDATPEEAILQANDKSDIEKLLFKYRFLDAIRNGHNELINGKRISWHVFTENGKLYISYQLGNDDWIDDAYPDEVPEYLLTHLQNLILSNQRLARMDATIEDREKINQKAIRIHRFGDPVRYILYTYNTQLHKGDSDLGLGILIGVACQSIHNTKGIQPKPSGGSGMGKSHAGMSMTHLLPQKYVLYETLSDNALYYMQDELRPGMVIFSDDIRMTEGLVDVIKRSTTRFQQKTTRHVTIREGDKLTTKKLEIPERIMWLLTSVDDTGGIQVVNRQLGFGVDESAAQDGAVVEFEQDKAVTGEVDLPETERVLVCRELIRMVKESEDGRPRLFTVKIPFAMRIRWTSHVN